MLKAIVFNALRVVQISTNGRKMSEISLAMFVGREQKRKKFLSIGTNSETKTRQKKHRGKISLLNHTAMTLSIVSHSGFAKKSPKFFLSFDSQK